MQRHSLVQPISSFLFQKVLNNFTENHQKQSKINSKNGFGSHMMRHVKSFQQRVRVVTTHWEEFRVIHSYLVPISGHGKNRVFSTSPTMTPASITNQRPTNPFPLKHNPEVTHF